MKGLNTTSFGHIYTSPSLFHYKNKYQLIADTKLSLDPIKIDIFVEKSEVPIQKQTCIIWNKDIKKPSISAHLPVHLKNQYMYL